MFDEQTLDRQLSEQFVAVDAALDARAAVSRTTEAVPDLAALTATVERLPDEGSAR